jgi:hypothetical protein
MNKGFKYSVIFHVTILLASFVYISTSHDIAPTERIIDIDLVNIRPGDTTNLKNSPIVTKNKEVKKDIPAPEKPKPLPPAPKPAPINDNSKAALVAPVPKIDKVIDVKEADAKAQSKANKELDNILDSLEKPLPDETSDSNSSGKENLATSDKPFDKSLPLTIAEQDNIKMQIERKFFNPIVSDFNSGEIIIKVKLDMKRNGEIEKITVLNSSSYASNHADTFIVLKDSLVRAAHMASPLKGLDEARYEGSNGWQEIELIFDAYYLMHL